MTPPGCGGRWTDEALVVLLRQATLAVTSNEGQGAREAARTLIRPSHGAGAPVASAARCVHSGVRVLRHADSRMEVASDSSRMRGGSESGRSLGPGKGLRTCCPRGGAAREEW